MKYNFNKSDYARLLNLTFYNDQELKDYIIEHYNSPNSIRMTDEEITFHTKRIVTPEESKIDKLYQLYKSDKEDEAIKLAFGILKYSPNDITTNQILCSIFINKKDLDMAMEYALIALRYDLEDPSSLLLMGQIMFLRNNVIAAMIYWCEVYHSNHISLIEKIGKHLIFNDYNNLGISFLERVLEIDPENEEVLSYMYQFYDEKGDQVKSMMYLKKFLKIYIDIEFEDLISILMKEADELAERLTNMSE